MLVLTRYPGQSEDMVSWSTGLQEDLLRTNWIVVVFSLPGWLCLCLWKDPSVEGKLHLSVQEQHLMFFAEHHNNETEKLS